MKMCIKCRHPETLIKIYESLTRSNRFWIRFYKCDYCDHIIKRTEPFGV